MKHDLKHKEKSNEANKQKVKDLRVEIESHQHVKDELTRIKEMNK